MGQLMETGQEKWKFYTGFEYELPTDEDLQTIKCVILPGSGRSVYDKKVEWIPTVLEFIRKVMNQYPHIKIIGGCFGEQSTAYAMGGKVEKMPYNPEKPKVLGREHIKPTDDFFIQPWVKSYMAKHDLTEETFPKIVLQESHGDHVAELPEGATLLANSPSCGVEMYCIGNRALCFQSHPDFNRGLQQELAEPEYFTLGDITEEYHKIAYAKCQDTSMGRETRNMVLGLLREFIHCK